MWLLGAGYEIPHVGESFELHIYEEIVPVSAPIRKEPIHQDKDARDNPNDVHELDSYIDEMSKKNAALKEEFDVSILYAIDLIYIVSLLHAKEALSQCLTYSTYL